jgi:ribonuclease P protein component
MALPQAHRLTQTEEFARVCQSGRQASTPHLVVKALIVPSADGRPQTPRFGITVSQKVSKRAVVRNRLKRQIRAGLMTLLPMLKSDLWIVIIVRSPATECDYWQFLQELKQLFLDLEVFDGH